MQRVKPPADISVHDFFTSWVVGAVNSDPDRQDKLGDTDATIHFELSGDGGGVYTIRIQRGRITGSAGNPADADLRVRVDVATWRKLNAGEISAPEALLKRQMKLEGDFLLGLKLHLILG